MFNILCFVNPQRQNTNIQSVDTKISVTYITCSPHSMHYCSSATIIMFDSSKGYENVKHCNKARNQATLLKIMNFKSSLHHLKFNREPFTYQESFVSINTKKNIGVLVSGVFETPVHVWFCKEFKNVLYW